jgi:hypothetical protein
MTLFNIKDYSTTARDLAKRYEKPGEHPSYRLSTWRFSVREGSTIKGYWDWVERQLGEERDELDKDNPYTQWEKGYTA